jgi:hypothetical protein
LRLQAQAQSQAAGSSLLARGAGAGAPAAADDWATAWRRHIYAEGLCAVPVGALPD